MHLLTHHPASGRDVDDTCTALPADSVSSFHDHLNSVNEHIWFTVEKQKDGVLPFLDVLLTHDSDGTISRHILIDTLTDARAGFNKGAWPST